MLYKHDFTKTADFFANSILKVTIPSLSDELAARSALEIRIFEHFFTRVSYRLSITFEKCSE
jgi:hypothetical protein